MKCSLALAVGTSPVPVGLGGTGMLTTTAETTSNFDFSLQLGKDTRPCYQQYWLLRFQDISPLLWNWQYFISITDQVASMCQRTHLKKCPSLVSVSSR
ncbi:hypothetical protein B0T13DRAFT_127873 [Neurospora crassa]|nr:hypothetical protein B0T13DRAFT_127873 [Neurospora crassa]